MKNIYIANDKTAKKIRNIFIGVNNIARVIKKGYIGVNGKAKLFFDNSLLPFSYLRELDPLISPAYYFAATCIGNYALFGGGRSTSSAYLSDVTAYNNELVRIKAPNLNAATDGLASASIENYALFGGGTQKVTAYNKELMVITPTALPYNHKWLAAGSMEKYILFGGSNQAVYSYDENLVYKALSNYLQTPTQGLTSVNRSKYVIFAGGVYTSVVSAVTAYDENLTRINLSDLTQARKGLASAMAGNYIVISGGTTSNSDDTPSVIVDVYDENMVHIQGPSLTEKRCFHSATTVNDYCFVSKGTSNIAYPTVAEIFSPDLVKTNIPDPGYKARAPKSATVGKYALFGGGSRSYNTLDKVDSYIYNG